MTTPIEAEPERRAGYHHGDLRAELIRVGIRQLEEAPSAALSLREIARAIGVSPAAPYRHFEGKEALLGAIAVAGYRRLADGLANKAPGAEGAARRLARFAERHPAWWDVMAREHSLADGELEEARASFLAELVGAVERDGRGKDPEATIRKAVTIWAAVLGLSRLRADGALTLLEEWMVPTAGEVAGVVLSARLSRPILPPRQ